MPRRDFHNSGPAAALAALTAIWGYNWIVMKVALVDAPALSFAALRSSPSECGIVAALGWLSAVGWRRASRGPAGV